MEVIINEDTGKMSSGVIECTETRDGHFFITFRRSDGCILSTAARPTGGNEDSSISAYIFDDAIFNREIMRGNIDVRAVCAELARCIRVKTERNI